MTAELIVMNKNGLALAADSAVTITIGGHARKIYNSANKLFTLSKYHPVGVMIYGSAEIMGLPWEAVIKRYREHLGKRSFSTVDEYADNLFHHLSTEAFGREHYTAFVRQRAVELLLVIAGDIDKKVEGKIKDEGGIEEDVIRQIHEECIQEAYSEIKKVQKSLAVKAADISGSVKIHRAMVAQIASEFRKGRPIHGAAMRKITDACLLFAILFPGFNKSGVVLAGFGDTQIFPSARAFDIEKILDGNIEFAAGFTLDVTLEQTACVKAFAQSSEVQSFMNGMSARIAEYVGHDMRGILSRALGEEVTNLLVQDGIVSEENKVKCKRYLESAGTGAHVYIQNAVNEISQREFVSPVIRAVEFFSPTEMATMAETLVSLESFRQQVTLSHETVGGPIDVSVITRGDGFIWIKRKHYFDPKLNHQFFVNYNRDRSDSDDDQDS